MNEVELELASWGWPRPRRRTGTEAQNQATNSEANPDGMPLLWRVDPKEHRTVLTQAGHCHRCPSYETDAGAPREASDGVQSFADGSGATSSAFMRWAVDDTLALATSIIR